MKINFSYDPLFDQDCSVAITNLQLLLEHNVTLTDILKHISEKFSNYKWTVTISGCHKITCIEDIHHSGYRLLFDRVSHNLYSEYEIVCGPESSPDYYLLDIPSTIHLQLSPMVMVPFPVFIQDAMLKRNPIQCEVTELHTVANLKTTSNDFVSRLMHDNDELTNGDTMRRRGIKSGSIIYSIPKIQPCEVYSANVNYCSIHAPKPSSSSVPLSLLKVGIIFNGQCECAMNLWLHPACPFEVIRTIIEIESDPSYFINKTRETIRQFDPNIILMLSKDALLRLNLHFLHTAAKYARAPVQYPLDLIEKAVMLEEAARLSPETQAIFHEIEKNPTNIYSDWIDYATEIQYQVAIDLVGIFAARKFVNQVRFTATAHVPHWKKYNRAGRGFLELGRNYTDSLLLHLQHTPTFICTSVNNITQNGVTIFLSSSAT